MTVRNRTAAERVVVALRDAVVRWEVKPGQPLLEEKLAEQFNVSRTPVREALRLLMSENLVRMIPGRGMLVTEVSATDLLEVWQVRGALEALAARLAASKERVSEEFHRLLEDFQDAVGLIERREYDAYERLTQRMDTLIVAEAGNELLGRVLESLSGQVKRLRRLAYRRPARLLETVPEHQEIIRAILAHQPDVAYRAVAVHIERSLRSILSQIGMPVTDGEGP